MDRDYENRTLAQLRAELWKLGIVPKKWMLNYVRKAEAIYLLTSTDPPEKIPAQYEEVIKKRASNHRRKSYRSKKNRDKLFGTALTKEERLKRVRNVADALLFVEIREFEEGFTSYLGSTKAKVSFVFSDTSGTEYLFTRSEVEKLANLGLFVPRGVLSSGRNKLQKPASATRTLKDIFGS